MDDDINFTYDANTEVYYSCAALLDDEMWVFGGSSKKRQVNVNLSDNAVNTEIFGITSIGVKCILDEQGSRLQVDKCW